MFSLDLLTDVFFFFFINLASILIVYNYCVPVQMVMQMEMGAVQVCVTVQIFTLKLSRLLHFVDVTSCLPLLPFNQKDLKSFF